MKFEMFDIEDYQSWGKLVKGWVTDPNSRPKNIDEFKAQVLKADPAAIIPDKYKDVELIPTSSADPILRIRLPPPDLLKEAEDALGAASYPLPDFYPDLMFNPNLTQDDPPGRLIFHNHRVGEYTIKFCG
jgi:hypothetical protein